MYPGASTLTFFKSLINKKEIAMLKLNKSITANNIFNILMSGYFETWHEEEFLDFVSGNSSTPGDIQKDIEGIFNVDTKTANKIFKVLMSQQFEDWYDNDFMDFVEGGGKSDKLKNKILKQIKELFL